MNLFIKGFIIGIAKIIPGVSGSMIAISFNVYDKLINSITHFFDNKRDNIIFLFKVISGIFLSIIFFSNIVRYLMNKYYFMMMMLFIGLIFGGTYNFSKNIKFNLKNIGIIFFVILLVLGISCFGVDNEYVIKNNFMDYIIFFLGGVVEVFSSIVPGVSGTALFMIMGIYDYVLLLLGNILNLSFVLDNILLYISYGVGIGLSFIFFSLGIDYVIKKYRNLFDTIVFGLSISSIILLVMMCFGSNFDFISLIVGIILLFFGIMISYVMDK